MFLANQKVVCINDKFPPGIANLFYEKLPKKGNIYTIKDVVAGVYIAGEEGDVALRLYEIVGKDNEDGAEWGFNSDRFAPMMPVVSALSPEPVHIEQEHAIAA
jgi:hypothetical protein